MKFCKYCGKELVEEKCTCQGFVENESAGATTNAGSATSAGGAISATAVSGGSGDVTEYLSLVKKMLIIPFDTIETNKAVAAQKMLIITGIQFLLLFVTILLGIPDIYGMSIEMEFKLKMAFLSIVIICISMLITGVILFAYAENKNGNTFLSILGQFGMALIPSTVLNIVAIIAAHSTMSLGFLLWGASIVSWIVLSTEIVRVNTAKKINIIHYIMMISILCAAGVGFNQIQEMINAIIESLFYSFW